MTELKLTGTEPTGTAPGDIVAKLWNYNLQVILHTIMRKVFSHDISLQLEVFLPGGFDVVSSFPNKSMTRTWTE